MQQRRLRPGDVLDDYCPRERRVTDHAIVAMIDDTVQRTRCVSCDAEHEYKGGRVPPQRRKKGAPGLFNQVLEGLQPPARPPHSPTVVDLDDTELDRDEAPHRDQAAGAPPVVPAPPVSAPSPVLSAGSDVGQGEPSEADAEPLSDDERQPPLDEGPIRRRLFRATLPKHEGQQVPARAVPEFTIRQPGSGRGQGRHGQSRGPARFGNRPGGRPQGGGHGQGHGRGHGSHGPSGQGGHGQGRPGGGRRRGGKKR